MKAGVDYEYYNVNGRTVKVYHPQKIKDGKITRLDAPYGIPKFESSTWSPFGVRKEDAREFPMRGIGVAWEVYRVEFRPKDDPLVACRVRRVE